MIIPYIICFSKTNYLQVRRANNREFHFAGSQIPRQSWTLLVYNNNPDLQTFGVYYDFFVIVISESGLDPETIEW